MVQNPSRENNPFSRIESNSITNRFRVRHWRLITPSYISNNLIISNQVPVERLTLQTADRCMARITKVLVTHCFTGEIGIAIYINDSSLSARILLLKIAFIEKNISTILSRNTLKRESWHHTIN